MFGFEGAQIVMGIIAAIGFLTVVWVLWLGSKEDHYPQSAADSAAATAWIKRAAKDDSATKTTSSESES